MYSKKRRYISSLYGRFVWLVAGTGTFFKRIFSLKSRQNCQGSIVLTSPTAIVQLSAFRTQIILWTRKECMFTVRANFCCLPNYSFSRMENLSQLPVYNKVVDLKYVDKW